MGNKIASGVDPVIMTADFLEQKIIEDVVKAHDLDMVEYKKLVCLDGLECDLVSSINLEHQNLVNVDDLWRYQLLTVLEMPNNLLQEIEGLDFLVNLKNLDLSFNYIKAISGLDNLKNLVKLNLSFNHIEILENMESLENLKTLLIRNNSLKSFNDVLYLSQFQSLTVLGINENPFVQDKDSSLQIIAILPNLKILDFVEITPQQLVEAKKKCDSQYKRDEARPALLENGKVAFKCPFIHADKEAYVDGLYNGQGFESMLQSDKNYKLLHSLPLVADISKEHAFQIKGMCDNWHNTGHRHYENIQNEKSEFSTHISKAKQFSLSVSQEEESKFIAFKLQMPKMICDIYQSQTSDEARDKKMQELKGKCEARLNKTFKNLLNSICLRVDLIINMCEIYEKSIEVINAQYAQDVESLIHNIIDTNEKFSYELQKFYFHFCEAEFDELQEIKTKDGTVFELTPEFLLLIQKQDLIPLVLKLSNKINSALLTERLDKLKLSLNKDLKETLQTVTDSMYFMESEQTRHIVCFCSRQQKFIENVFQKNLIFKNYLGYR